MGRGGGDGYDIGLPNRAARGDVAHDLPPAHHILHVASVDSEVRRLVESLDELIERVVAGGSFAHVGIEIGSRPSIHIREAAIGTRGIVIGVDEYRTLYKSMREDADLQHGIRGTQPDGLIYVGNGKRLGAVQIVLVQGCVDGPIYGNWCPVTELLRGHLDPFVREEMIQHQDRPAVKIELYEAYGRRQRKRRRLLFYQGVP